MQCPFQLPVLLICLGKKSRQNCKEIFLLQIGLEANFKGCCHEFLVQSGVVYFVDTSRLPATCTKSGFLHHLSVLGKNQNNVFIKV